MTNLTFAVEEWSSCANELKEMWSAHHEEVELNQENIKLDIWEEGFNVLAKLQSLHVVVARDKNKAVGYHISLINPHLHHKNILTAYSDAFYLCPEYRKGFNGINLFKVVEKTLKERGIKMITAMTKVRFDKNNKNIGKRATPDKSKIFERMGWIFTEKIFVKYL